MISRGEITDFLVADGESLALLESTVLRLGPVATVILQLLEQGPSTEEQVARALEAEFGAPPEGSLRDAVEEQLNVLATAGLITRGDEPA
jgi:PqqD family protein of HPr-rel-A system